ncbi:MAG: transglutaminase family protein [Planctomycetaceae bacterium]
MKRLLAVCLLLLGPAVRASDEPPADAAPDSSPERSVEELAAAAKPAVVVVSFRGRDGERQGLGTGVIIDSQGLVATNLHVIGEARPISVRLMDGREFDVTAIHATERSQDLAILKIEGQQLPVLPVGNSDELKDGQAVVAIGNPLGLEHSVVAGVLSGRREIDGRPMLQVAIPIERGNSGGPLLDRFGRVHGLLTMKSLKTENLGFAVPINALKPLIEKPNPIAMTQWLTIGVLDPEDWLPLAGARWRQRAGKIHVDGRGAGIGGRALCLSAREVPQVPYEIAVQVKYAPEEGAAGLVFHADGGDRHYGFYPSNGELRLSRFDGSDVYAWQVLKQIRAPQLKPAGWNALKVRIEAERFVCFVNGEQVLEWKDDTYKTGKAGLCKFRQTEAEFKDFQVGQEVSVPSDQHPLSEEILQQLTRLPTDRAAPDEVFSRLAADGAVQETALEAEALRLEERAKRIRDMAADIHRTRVQAELSRELNRPDAEIDLFHAALLLSKIDNADLNVEAYLQDLDRLAKKVRQGFTDDVDDAARLAALDRVLFQELGFHGSRTDYQNPSNSYLNEVLDDREGLPITLAVLYMELGRRVGLKIEGVGLPGHFVARVVPQSGEPQLIDVFEQGKRLSREEAIEKFHAIQAGPWRDEFLAAQSVRAILVRMLRNLFATARDARKADEMYGYVDTLLSLESESASDRFVRAILAYQTQRYSQARRDVDWLLERRPENVDFSTVEELGRLLTRLEIRSQ